MKKCVWYGCWAAVLTVAWQASALAFVSNVLEYDSGVGFATEFGTGLGYTDPMTVLGAPNRDTSFGPVTPFNPPFARSELLSLGEGGYLVVQMQSPIFNDPAHAFGLDFLIYGSAGFIDIDYPNGRTDGAASLFGFNDGETRVYVSADNVDYYMLDPGLAPTVDTLYPTDGEGLFGVPVDPSLSPIDLANLTFGELQQLYAGSAGGAGYDLAWARDAMGQPVPLDAVEFIRIEVWSGRAEIDALAVVPEPGRALWLSAFGVLGWWAVRRRRTRTAGVQTHP